MTPTFAELLRLYRERAALRQHHLATTLGVSRDTVSRWECGTYTPIPGLVPGIVAALELTSEDAAALTDAHGRAST